MYSLIEIDSDKTDILRAKGTGSYLYFNIIDDFIENMFAQINTALEETYETNPSRTRFRTVFEKKTDKDEMTDTKGIYYYDFRIIAEDSVSREQWSSHGMRVKASSKTGDGGQIGVRCTDISGTGKNMWRDETISGSGQASLPCDYAISSTTITPAAMQKIASVVSNSHRAYADFSVIITDDAFLLYVKRSRYEYNLISFIRLYEVFSNDTPAWLTNGWNSMYESIDKSSKQDIFMKPSATKSAGGAVLLKDILIADYSSKEIKWYMPNIYLTHEQKTNHFSDYLIRHTDLSTGELIEADPFKMSLINTLPLKTSYIYAIKKR